MEPVSTAVDAAAQSDSAGLVRDYIVHHALYHMADLDSWNVPFMHIRALDFFRYDGFMVVFSALLVVFLFGFLYNRRGDVVPHGLTNLLEVFVLFIRNDISIAFLGEKDGRRMAPLFCTFFFFILIMNLLGLVPIFSTATSNINVTGSLAAITLAFMVFGSIYRNGFLGFLKVFVPSGVPWPILLILVPVEIISMFSKAIALTIRLFANMLAGHILIFALLGLAVMFGVKALPVIAIAVCIFFFELFVAFFQAYIFTLLSAVFIGQMVHPEH